MAKNKINEKLVKYNFSSRKGTPIKYIVLHDTANKKVGADADAHFEFFNARDRQSSAHYFVDDKQILRIIKDQDKSWAVGDGKGKYGITNENSINVEMCINADGDINKTYDNTLFLIKDLMEHYNIPLDRVVRHYDASKKICPNIWSYNNWNKWYKFKKGLENLNKPKVDYKAVINKLYVNIFGRAADAEGLNYWNDKLINGLTFGDFLKSLGESEEFKEIYIYNIN